LIYETTDLWLLSKLSQTIEITTEYFESFEYYDARLAVEKLFWNYCDNYIELIKKRLYDDQNPKPQMSGIATLYYSLQMIIKMLAPFLPHITEEIYQNLFDNKLYSIHQKSSWPKFHRSMIQNDTINIGDGIITILELVRKAKSLSNISIAKMVSEIQIRSDIELKYLSDLKNAINTEKMTIVNDLSGEVIASECGNYAVQIVN
jgi:valyl-tRNA synthetase